MSTSVLILGEYPPPFGGVAIHIRSFVPYLLEHGYDVQIVSAGTHSGLESHEGFDVHRLTHDRVASVKKIAGRIPTLVNDFVKTRFFSDDFLKAQVIAAAAEPLIANADLICAYHIFPWGFAGAMLAEKYKKPLCLVHFGEVYASEPYYRKNIRQVKFIADRASEVVAASQHCARSLGNLGIEYDVKVVPMGVDLESLNPSIEREEIRNRYGIKPTDQVVLYLGRMHKNLGLHTVLEAIPKFSGKAKTIIAGASGELTGAANELARSFPDQVFVAPDFPFEDLSGFYGASDVVVAPSPDNRPCMGLAIKEAMACGKPVIACDIGGIPEAVDHGVTGLLIPTENADSLALSVSELLEDPKQRQLMGQNGRLRAADLFSVEKTNQRLESIFSNVLGN